MDWSFWVGLGLIAALWGASQWFFSWRRHSEQVRARSREQADGIVDAERAREQGRYWSGFGG
ncbi:hypothetical protein GE115_04895 [Agromyces sp. CFH 90414]|uniref:Uncharacterized protein n=1 Tax=Agromyces agglutinans TaxID=2662258 RepID=A0A6I2FDN8_9MICO|nr:hypothetical protein [Agromyces agglutinans]MRG59208.1 hypothetical protein [Agromyces agglutinans]